MLKIILVIQNKNLLNSIINLIEFKNTNLLCVIMDSNDSTYLKFENMNVPIYSAKIFSSGLQVTADTYWLICGYQRRMSEIGDMAKVLREKGIAKSQIINFSFPQFIGIHWIKNLRYAEKHSIECFATGISYTEVGLDWGQINIGSPMKKFVNLACSSQDIKLGYLTAKYIFEHQAVPPRLVVIGLAPYSFQYDSEYSFSAQAAYYQYYIAMGRNMDDVPNGAIVKKIMNDQLALQIKSITAEGADLNYMSFKQQASQIFPLAEMMGAAEEVAKHHTKKFDATIIKKNLCYFEDYISLCLSHGTKPIIVIWPFAPNLRNNYSRDFLDAFRLLLSELQKRLGFGVVDLFDLPLGYDCFYNMVHLNMRGAMQASRALNGIMQIRNLSAESSLDMTYEGILQNSTYVTDQEFRAYLEKLFDHVVKNLRGKRKILVGFILYDSSMWCGDELYKLFEQHTRYEPTVYMGLRTDAKEVSAVRKDFEKGIEQFRSKGIRVIGVDDEFASDIKMDIAFCLTPYNYVLPMKLKFMAMKANTLLVSIPYGLDLTNIMAVAPIQPVEHVAWKKFVENEAAIEWNREYGSDKYRLSEVSGHPKMDAVYKHKNAEYRKWKLVRADAKKIIWAPHWSISAGVFFATFQYNYEFFYQYAKSHPETSWIVKPHPNLLFSAVENKIFSSEMEFHEYLAKWDDLPNACVETGAYYQDMFITSDAMILDSASFTMEYQYTGKPLLFLTRDTQKFNEIGNALMQVLYRADGRSFADIEQFIENVVVKSNDTMRETREDFFCKNLDYAKKNGKTASQYIFDKINQAVGEY